MPTRTHQSNLSIALHRDPGYDSAERFRTERPAILARLAKWLMMCLVIGGMSWLVGERTCVANCGVSSRIEIEKLVYGDLNQLRRDGRFQIISWEWLEESGSLGVRITSPKPPCNSPECQRPSSRNLPIQNSVIVESQPTFVGVSTNASGVPDFMAEGAWASPYPVRALQWSEVPVPPPRIV